MEKKKEKIIGAGIIVFALVVAIGVVYAAYTQSLYINGDATVKANLWKIRFANLSEVKLTGEAKQLTAPTINTNDTTIGDYSVLISKPGDSITYTFDIVNEGTFDASAPIPTITTPTCTGMGEDAIEDAANVCKYLTYTLTIPATSTEDGTRIKLPNKTTITGCTLTLTYSADVPHTELPKNDVAISGLDKAIVFSQDKF